MKANPPYDEISLTFITQKGLENVNTPFTRASTDTKTN